MSNETDQPIQVVKGEPTEAELAALVAVVSAKAAEAAASDDRSERPTSWASYWRSVRRSHQPGRGAWRASALPH